MHRVDAIMPDSAMIKFAVRASPGQPLRPVPPRRGRDSKEKAMKHAFTFLALASLSLPAAAAGDSVPFPEGYRDWHHVKSMVIEQGHPLFDSFGGIHHLYANEAAVTGYRQGIFPDGAVIVFDLLEAVHADSAVTEGE